MVDVPTAIDLYERGYTLESIGRLYGVSRQRIWQKIKPHYASLNAHRKTEHNGGTTNPRKAEKYVYKRLVRLGYKVEHQGYNSPFDLLVNGKKVQVKQRSNMATFRTRGVEHSYFVFYQLKEKIKPNFYIFVCGKLNRHPFVCIVPGKDINTTFSVGKSKQTLNARKYRENWDLLKV